jgi:hypothetical protein
VFWSFEFGRFAVRLEAKIGEIFSSLPSLSRVVLGVRNYWWLRVLLGDWYSGP